MLLSLKQAASLSGKSERMLRRMIKLDRLPAQLIHGRYHIEESDLQTLPKRKTDQPMIEPAQLTLPDEKAVDLVYSVMVGAVEQVNNGQMKPAQAVETVLAASGTILHLAPMPYVRTIGENSRAAS